MTSAFDAAVLSLLDASPKIVLWRNKNTHAGDLTVLYDGRVEDADEKNKTISAPLPYLVFHATPGRPVRPRLGRGSTMREGEFQITAVGSDRLQAKWASELAEGLLDETVIVTAPGARPRRIRRTDEDPYVTKDEAWTRPDGRPLFLVATRYAAGTRRPTSTT
jgi:hypothetical protein